MGIKQLFQFIQAKAPNSYREVKMNLYTKKTVAYDAYNVIYQFIVQTSYTKGDNYTASLTDKDGNKTGHLVGIINRIIAMTENKVNCIWVFDGKPPEIKMEELKRRKAMKEKAKADQEEAKEIGTAEDQAKFSKRNVSISEVMKEDAKKLIKLLGHIVFEAKGEAESQCVELVKKGKADAVASEDLDCLTFGAPILLRNFKSTDKAIIEIMLDKVLDEIELSYEQFIDFCILCGCDYVSRIGNLGPNSAYELIKQHNTIEEVMAVIEQKNKESMEEKQKLRYIIPPDANFRYKEAREQFKILDVFDCTNYLLPEAELQEEALISFLVDEKGFDRSRLDSQLKRLSCLKKKKPQSTLESFFGRPVASKQQNNTGTSKKNPQNASKRKMNPESKHTGQNRKRLKKQLD